MCIGSGLFGLFCDPIDAHTNLSLPLTAGFLAYILLPVAIAYAKKPAKPPAEELQEVITNCDNPDRLRFSPALPFAFTEQGSAMLSGILNSDVAVQTSIRLMNTFVGMRRALATLAPLLTRIEAAERRQIADQAKNEENQKRPGVTVTVVRSAQPRLTNRLHAADVSQFNKQCGGLTEKRTDKFHDRYLIIDNATLIHVGASLNHLGRRCFAFSTLAADFIPDIVARVP